MVAGIDVSYIVTPIFYLTNRPIAGHDNVNRQVFPAQATAKLNIFFTARYSRSTTQLILPAFNNL